MLRVETQRLWQPQGLSKSERGCNIACCILRAEGCCEAAPISVSTRIMPDDQTSKGPQAPVMSLCTDQGQSVALAVYKRDLPATKGPSIPFSCGRSTTGMGRCFGRNGRLHSKIFCPFALLDRRRSPLDDNSPGREWLSGSAKMPNSFSEIYTHQRDW
jgi:hypothetical protein